MLEIKFIELWSNEVKQSGAQEEALSFASLEGVAVHVKNVDVCGIWACHMVMHTVGNVFHESLVCVVNGVWASRSGGCCYRDRRDMQEHRYCSGICVPHESPLQQSEKLAWIDAGVSSFFLAVGESGESAARAWPGGKFTEEV